eukprot:1963713-Pyramimonas_sp.AAC.3
MLLAERLTAAGPEAAGMALGRMCSFSTAEALPLMNPADAGAVLLKTRPEAAIKVDSPLFPSVSSGMIIAVPFADHSIATIVNAGWLNMVTAHISTLLTSSWWC